LCNGIAVATPKPAIDADPLLCELHAHTTFSDGALNPSELVDLYGSAGFDVLAITDHVCRSEESTCSLRAEDHARYLETLAAEAERAWCLYGLLVIPGLELTWEDVPERSAHALAVGVRDWIGLDEGLDQALRAAEATGAALIGAHPYTLAATVDAPRTTARFTEEREWSREAVHRFELCNRHDFFAWVAEERLPVVANGDFHRPEHLATWKTLLPCAQEEEAVVGYLRSRREVGLTRLDPAVLVGREPARAA
jgi:predicted metal-dependent phosphoesterase TrpH